MCNKSKTAQAQQYRSDSRDIWARDTTVIQYLSDHQTGPKSRGHSEYRCRRSEMWPDAEEATLPLSVESSRPLLRSSSPHLLLNQNPFPNSLKSKPTKNP